MNELIRIGTSKGGKRTVNARELHEFLEVGKDFSTWIKGRILKYDFVENRDFIRVRSVPQNGGIVIDYHVTLDMAKELSMVERNEKGKQARQYFIECERRLKKNQHPNSLNVGQFDLNVFASAYYTALFHVLPALL